MQNPTRLQRFFAGPWSWAGVPALVAATGVGLWCWVYVTASHEFDLAEAGILVGGSLAAGIAGFLVGAIANVSLLCPLWWFRAKINGAPFEIGDEVLILSGKHRDRIVRIHAVWEIRGQVRVDIGEQEKRDYKDVFCELGVCRTA